MDQDCVILHDEPEGRLDAILPDEFRTMAERFGNKDVLTIIPGGYIYSSPFYVGINCTRMRDKEDVAAWYITTSLIGPHVLIIKTHRQLEGFVTIQEGRRVFAYEARKLGNRYVYLKPVTKKSRTKPEEKTELKVM